MYKLLFCKQATSYCLIRMLVLAGLIVISFLPSCTLDREVIDGSFEGNTTHEGGNSAIVNSDEFGWNFMNELCWGVGGYGTGAIGQGSGGDEKTWLPYDYVAAPSSAGGWMTSNMFGFVQKGYKTQNFKVKLDYLEISQKILYNYRLKDGSSLFGGLGPYIAYGIGGKSSGSGFSESSFGGANGYKRFDAGLQLGAGYYLSNGLEFQLGYDLGLANISPAPDFTSHTRSWSFAVGYSLPKIIAAFRKK